MERRRSAAGMAKLLILGGTSEAAELAARLAGDDRFATVTSLAGLARLPTAAGARQRRGGFAGPDGLAAFLADGRYGAVIDATHPFAGRIATHAAEAAVIAGVPRLKLLRPPFERAPEDRIVAVPDMTAAAAALPPGSRAFVAAGRREIAAFAARRDIWCLTRMVEPPSGGEALPVGEIIVGRPSPDPQAERELLLQHRIGWVVAKDSGGAASAKIVAARGLGLTVLLVERPPFPPGPSASTVDEAVGWIDRTLFAAS